MFVVGAHTLRRQGHGCIRNSRQRRWRPGTGGLALFRIGATVCPVTNSPHHRHSCSKSFIPCVVRVQVTILAFGGGGGGAGGDDNTVLPLSGDLKRFWAMGSYRDLFDRLCASAAAASTTTSPVKRTPSRAKAQATGRSARTSVSAGAHVVRARARARVCVCVCVCVCVRERACAWAHARVHVRGRLRAFMCACVCTV